MAACKLASGPTATWRGFGNSRKKTTAKAEAANRSRNGRKKRATAQRQLPGSPNSQGEVTSHVSWSKSIRSSHAVETRRCSIPRTKGITQLELELLLSLRGRLHQLQEQVESAEQSIKTRLETGATLEPGDHRAELKENFRRNVSWKDASVRLANKLYDGKGLGYVERILRKTKPSRTVSFVIE
jgi:hypothetical protein